MVGRTYLGGARAGEESFTSAGLDGLGAAGGTVGGWATSP